MDVLTIASAAIASVSGGRMVYNSYRARSAQQVANSQIQKQSDLAAETTSLRQRISQLESDLYEAQAQSTSVSTMAEVLRRFGSRHVGAESIARWLSENATTLPDELLRQSLALLSKEGYAALAALVLKDEKALYSLILSGEPVLPSEVFRRFVQICVDAGEYTGRHVWEGEQESEVIVGKSLIGTVRTATCALCSITKRETHIENGGGGGTEIATIMEMDGWFIGSHRLTKEECIRACGTLAK